MMSKQRLMQGISLIAVLSWLTTPVMSAGREIRTMTTPDILMSRQQIAAIPSQEPVSFKTNTVAALHILTKNLTFLFKHFAVFLGAMVILASLFQYFRYRQNPMATRLSYVASTFLCGVILLGISMLEAGVL